jgi:hypothetical protein
MSGKSNHVANALSRSTTLVTKISIEVVVLEILKGLYKDDVDFVEAWRDCKQ